MEEREGRARPGGHVPQRGLHPVQGAAFFLGGIREGGPPPGRARHHGLGLEDRRRQDAGAEGFHRHQDDEGRGVPLQEEQDHVAAGLRQVRLRGGLLRHRGVEWRRRHQGEARHHRHRLACAAPAEHDGGQRPHLRQRRRARLSLRAQAAGRDRRRRDRPGAGKRVAPARLRSHDPRGAAEFPRRLRRGDRQGGVEAVHQDAGPQHQDGREDRQGHLAQDRRGGRLRRRQGPRAEARMRPAHRLRGPRAEHGRAGCRDRRPQGRCTRLHRGG